MSNRALAALLLLGAIWGASFMFMRVAAPEFGIFTLVELRTVPAVFSQPVCASNVKSVLAPHGGARAYQYWCALYSI